MKILFCGDAFPDEPDYLRQRLGYGNKDELVVCPNDDICPMLEGVDVVVPRMGRVGRREMEKGSFKLVQQWGAGLEGVDLAAARELGISVANVPATGGNAESVAEHTILLILALLRDLRGAQANGRKGVLGAPLGKVLAGRRVCLYGLGAIALPLVKRLRAFGVELIGVTRDLSAPKVKAYELDRCYPIEDRKLAFAEQTCSCFAFATSKKCAGVSGWRNWRRCVWSLSDQRSSWRTRRSWRPLRCHSIRAPCWCGTRRLCPGTCSRRRTASCSFQRHFDATYRGGYGRFLPGHSRDRRNEYREATERATAAQSGLLIPVFRNGEYMAPWKLLAAFFVIGTLAFDADAQTSKAQPPEHGPSFKGHHARNFVLRDLSGKRVSLKDFAGKPVVVNFWATWCPPCLQEMPIFEELQKKYATSGLTFLGINVDVETGSASEPKVAATAKRLGVTYPVLLSDRSLTAGYGSVPMLPETFYINRKGTIVEDVWTHTDKPGIEAHIQEIIR